MLLLLLLLVETTEYGVEIKKRKCEKKTRKNLEAIFPAAPMGFHDTGCGVLNRGLR
jgi:hypothetical protein